MKPKVIAAVITSCILVLAVASIPFLAWSNQTGSGVTSSPAIRMAIAPPLGVAESFPVLGALAVTNTGASILTGDLGISPNNASSVTGFPPGSYTGTLHAADAVALQAQSDVTTAYNDLAGQACDVNLTGQNLGGLTLTPGVYCFSSSAQLTGILTLDAVGDTNAIWVFQIGSTLTTAGSSSVDVINGGQDCNVFWQVGSSATLGTGTALRGNILALTSITLDTGAGMSGRALARNGAVTLDKNNVAVCATLATPTPTPPGGPTPTATPTPACVEAVLSLSARAVSPGRELKFTGCIPAFGNQAVDVYLVLVSPTGVVYSAISPDGITPGIHPYERGIINPSTCQCRDLLTYVVCAKAQPGVWTAVLAVLPAGAAPKAENAIAIATTTVVVGI